MPRRPIVLTLLLLTLVTVLYAWYLSRPPTLPNWPLPGPVRNFDEPRSLPSARRPEFLRVLFIGNSFTNYYGGVPLAVTTLRQSSPGWKDDRPPIFEQVTEGGASLESHWAMQSAVHRIREGAWDYVVLQGHSQEPLLEPAAFRAYAKRFADEARHAGAAPVLYMTWPREHQPENGPLIAAAYESLGHDLDADVVPVGLAFAESIAAHPEIGLYEKDGKHPSFAGSYLVACCFYAFFYDRPATGLAMTIPDPPVSSARWITLDAPTAAKLQRVAYDVVHAWRGAHPRPTTQRGREGAP